MLQRHVQPDSQVSVRGSPAVMVENLSRKEYSLTKDTRLRHPLILQT